MYYLPLLYTFLLIGPAIAGIAFFRRPSIGWHFFLLGLCVLYGVSPLLMTWGAYGLAKRFSCVAEAVRFSCPSPVWLGDAISGLAMSHWLAIFAIPSAVLGATGCWFRGFCSISAPKIQMRLPGQLFTGVVATKSLLVYVRPWRNDGISLLK